VVIGLQVLRARGFEQLVIDIGVIVLKMILQSSHLHRSIVQDPSPCMAMLDTRLRSQIYCGQRSRSDVSLRSESANPPQNFMTHASCRGIEPRSFLSVFLDMVHGSSIAKLTQTH
jgi:hypothetical protein